MLRLDRRHSSALVALISAAGLILTMGAVLARSPVSAGDGSDGDVASISTEAVGAEALVLISPGGNLTTASTFGFGSFQVTNNSTAGQNITLLRLDLSTAILPDVVFDPFGTAGDPDGKDFTSDSDPGVGLLGGTFLGSHDGGFDILEVTFNDFNPGETFTFSADIDPTSVKGAAAPGPNDSGSVSGLELVGAEITVEFDNASTISRNCYREPSSDTGCRNILKDSPPLQPGIQALGIASTPVALGSSSQTIRVIGSPGESVALLNLEGGLFTAGVPGGGFDLDPFEANSAVAVTEYFGTIGGGGLLDIPVVLTKTGAEGGYNHIVAVFQGPSGETGPTSTLLLLQLVDTCVTNVDCNDGDVCTDDVCNGLSVCENNPNTASCDDGVACTAGDACSAGICAGADVCTGGEVCNPGTGTCGAPPPPGPAVVSLTLIDADSDGPILAHDPLLNGTEINFATLPSTHLNVRANTSGAPIGSVVFDLDGSSSFQTENVSPYALAGDVSGDYNPWTPSLGSHSLIATPYEGTGGSGNAGTALSISFSVVNQVSSPGQLGASPLSFDFGLVAIGTSPSQNFVLTNLGAGGDPIITVNGVTAAGAFSEDFGGPVVLGPGDSTSFNAGFTPTLIGSTSSSLAVFHDGANSPLSIPLDGTGFDPGAQPISFNKSTLGGVSLDRPTTLQIGPDGRLYVGQQNGLLKVFTVVRNGPTDYQVTDTETITLIQFITNHNDDGAVNGSVNNRQVTGILVEGTASQPVIYVASSDPRIGAGSGGTDLGLDTNSGVVSRLTWNGGGWDKLDLVRGLPRSEENHGPNGLQLDPATNTLYLAVGGNTNQGAPSHNFAELPEYALSAAILAIDLTAIGEATYDLPTLDDPARAGANDANDPFGGNDGANQAKLVVGGPVQIYSPGWRNAYDLLITADGRMYTIDNGSNGGWGDVPINEGPSGDCTNGLNEPGDTHLDNLHLVTGPGYYGGHPNPTRGNTSNTFNGQTPIEIGANPVECDYRTPGSQDGALATWSYSTNGLAEYVASNFGGVLQGDLLAAGFNNSIQRIQLNSAGDTVTLVEALFSSVGALPLDVIAQGDAAAFPGTIWVADYSNDAIVVYEPIDFSTCTGADDPGLDEDGDGYDNADEIDNGTSPCSPGDVPPDADGDLVSDLNDPDDDNDGWPDNADPFAIDPDNGNSTSLPIAYTWDNDAPDPGGLLGLGFTGLMSNGVDDYESLFELSNMAPGGAAGVVTVDLVPAGDALGGNDDQQYGFQVGVDVGPSTGLFTAHTRVVGPFLGLVPADFQSMGLFIGTGDQDNYAKLVVAANGGAGGIEMGLEVAGTFQPLDSDSIGLPGPDAVDLYLTVDTGAGTVQASYHVITGGVSGPLVVLGTPEILPSTWLSGPSGLAVGILSTSRGSGAPFPATWDFIEVQTGPAGECTSDGECDDGDPCTDDTCTGQICEHLPNTAPCDDGVVCTASDFCAGGFCAGQDACPLGQVCNSGSGLCQNACLTAAECDDFDDCTNDQCDSGICTYTPNAAACDDGIACTAGDVCSAGICAGVASCPPGEICNVGTGLCEAAGDLDHDGLMGGPDPCPLDPRNRCFGPAAVDTGTGQEIRLNANVSSEICSGVKVDCNGDTWLADFGYNQAGNASACDLANGCPVGGLVEIFGCQDSTTEQLFQCEHWDPSGSPELIYSFALPDGEYVVNLLFANSYTGTTTIGSRVFDIFVENQLVYDNFDQVEAAGGSGVAVIRAARVTVADGNGLQVELGHEAENPSLKGLEVLASGCPNAVSEVCDGVDNDCDGEVDEGFDMDGDGFSSCGGDCDDLNPAIQPGATEICDGADNDCNALVDEGFDLDGDGFTSCGGDCNDLDPAVHPDAPEICDGIDNNCNSVVDEDVDQDGDGFTSCGGDCNDLDPTIHPGAPEICDGTDNDCDSLVDEGFDVDTDGYTSCGGDCNDADPDIHPGRAEACDGIDTNCDGAIDEGFDQDLDGYTSCGGDCDDGNGSVNPGAPEVCDSLDDDCDGLVDEGFDQDGDGFTSCGGDCNDLDDSIHPAAVEACDSVDNDCDGSVDEDFDVDGDGYTSCGGDCDDTRADVNPSAPEMCDGVDNDCDGSIDFAFQDQDGDGLDDACDPCPLDPANDVDADGVCGDTDNCPTIPNPAQTPSGLGDGLGDACEDKLLVAEVLKNKKNVYVRFRTTSEWNCPRFEVFRRDSQGEAVLATFPCIHCTNGNGQSAGYYGGQTGMLVSGAGNGNNVYVRAVRSQPNACGINLSSQVTTVRPEIQATRVR